MAPNLVEKLLNPDWNEVAQKCGFTRVHVARIVRGQNHTTLDGAAKVARALGVTLDTLYGHIEASRAARATVAARVARKTPPLPAKKTLKTAPKKATKKAAVALSPTKKR